MDSMPTDIYNSEFQNWIKGVLGVKETRSALCRFATEKIEDEILSFSKSEKHHLKMFIRCLTQNNIKHFQTFEKIRRRLWKCSHTLCETLMKHLMELHASPIKTECKWTFLHVKESDDCNLSQDNPEEVCDADKEEVVWNLMQLYMFGEKETDDRKKTCLGDLDISKVIKMMRNFILCRFDDSERLYQNVIDVRNVLMHSPDNQIEDEKTRAMFEKLMELLTNITNTGSSSCTDALKYLKQLEDNSFSIKYQSKEYKEMVKNVLKIKQTVFELDNSIAGSSDGNQTRTRILKELLQETTRDINEADFEDERLSLELQPADYKHLVQSTIEIKKEAIDTDLVECENNGESKAELQVLQEETKHQLEAVTKIVSEPDPTELINSLSEQVKALKTECNEFKSEIVNYDKEISKLKTENTKLKEVVVSSDILTEEHMAAGNEQSLQEDIDIEDVLSEHLHDTESSSHLKMETEETTFDEITSEVTISDETSDNTLQEFARRSSVTPPFRTTATNSNNLTEGASTTHHSSRKRQRRTYKRTNRKLKCNQSAISNEHVTFKDKTQTPSGMKCGRKPQRKS